MPNGTFHANVQQRYWNANRNRHLWPEPIANASNLMPTSETASVINDSNLFLHLNMLRDDLNADGSTVRLHFCSGCYSAVYCSETCQRLDWQTHKMSCRCA